MSVGLDCGGKSAWGWDHPPNKNEMSRRLALQTVHAAYAQQGRIPAGAACPPSSDPEAAMACGDSLWTGPVVAAAALQNSATGHHAVAVSFAAFSAVGLKLVDTKPPKNPDGSTNDCTRCCAALPPFEVARVSSGGGGGGGNTNWTRVPHGGVTFSGSTVVLSLPADFPSPNKVRYAWADYVDCTLANNDSLPAGPFLLDIVQWSNGPMAAAAAAAATGGGDAGPQPAQGAVEQQQQQYGSPPHLIPADALPPPMGFNSWNYYHCNIDEVTVRAVLDAIATNGMKEAGYKYVNIDGAGPASHRLSVVFSLPLWLKHRLCVVCSAAFVAKTLPLRCVLPSVGGQTQHTTTDCWQVERFPNGTIQPDPTRFPSGMKALADYAHSKGLKFGVVRTATATMTPPPVCSAFRAAAPVPLAACA